MGEIGVPPALTDAVASLKDAVSAGRTDIFRKLLEACETCEGGGVEERKQLVNSLATSDGTFLHMATKLGHSDIVRALLAAGADPGVIDRNGNTPIQVSPSSSILSIFMEDLLRATAKSEIGRVCQLIASGMSVNAHDNQLSRNTPLHWAASFADLDTLNCLIARGADVNSCNSHGATPLHDAVARADEPLVEALLEQGSNPHIQCHRGPHQGKTALDMAKENAKLKKLMDKFMSVSFKPNEIHTEVSNGSVSPVLRKSLPETGSIESLVSIGTDSVLSNSTELNNNNSSSNSNQRHKLIREQSLSSVGEEMNHSLSNGVNGVNSPRVTRSPLQSTSSLELAPNMEQVCERLSSVHLTTPPRPLVTNGALHHLWPQPKRITELSGPPWKAKGPVTVAIASGPVPVHQIVDVWNIHKPRLSELDCEVHLGCIVASRGTNREGADVEVIVNRGLVVSEHHYSVTVEEKGIRMVCGSTTALHHALVTFAQLLHIFSTREAKEEKGALPEELCIPSLVLIDFPSIVNRGFIMDMSPMARIPTLVRVCQIVDTLVSLKMNQLHLVFKITSAAGGGQGTNEFVRFASNGTKGNFVCQLPFSGSELVSLDRYCSDRGLLLIPGFDVESSGSNSRLSVSDVSTAMSEALSNLPSVRYVHIGPGLTSLLADASCQHCVSPWTQLQVPDTALLMVCANVFHNNAPALEKLPLSCVLVEYGFQADYDFSNGCQLALEKGRPLALCPGTSAWSSLSGWPEAGVSNVYSGVVSSLECGSTTVLVAHWSNTACLTPLVFTWPPLLVAAGLAWNHTTHWDFVHSSVGSLIDRHIVRVPHCGLGDALIELGRCETWITRVARDQSSNDPRDLPSCVGSTLHQILTDPDAVVVDHLNSEVFASVMRHVRKAVKEGRFPSSPDWGGRDPPSSPSPSSSSPSSTPKVYIGQVSSLSPWPMASLAVLELHLAMDMILTACRLGRALVTMGTNPRSNMGMAVVNPGVGNLPPTMRTDLANKVLALREVYSSVWLQGHRHTGLHSSLLVFSSLLSRLLPEQSVYGV